ncbi:MAG: hypothetical protein A2091_13280 [Desulfuromonadales bacterium GWD2_61_12]|nr:MAG: hypothetical protein A2091_13280 [Desulfuromonadales bacterium GWD2_61_12]HAD04050.1 hypothetical protein [Desulfuromonas sp.]
MSNYFPDIIDGAVNVLFTIAFISLYFIPKYPKLYKKKWLLLAAVFFLILGGNSLYKGAKNYAGQRIPQKAEVEQSLLKNGQLALDDFIYTSPDGFKILIPSGFTYSVPSGAISLMAVKTIDQNANIALIVLKLNDSKSLDQLISDIMKLDANGKKYFFDKDIQRQYLRRGYVEVLKDGVSGKAAIALIKNENSIYQVMMSTKNSHFEKIEPIFERVLNSFSPLKI